MRTLSLSLSLSVALAGACEPAEPDAREEAREEPLPPIPATPTDAITIRVGPSFDADRVLEMELPGGRSDFSGQLVVRVCASADPDVLAEPARLRVARAIAGGFVAAEITLDAGSRTNLAGESERCTEARSPLVPACDEDSCAGSAVFRVQRRDTSDAELRVALRATIDAHFEDGQVPNDRLRATWSEP
jgi:hypothetical protein